MLSPTLRDKALEFISSTIDLADLEEWLVPLLPELVADPDSDDAAVTAAIELCFAEYSEGIMSEEDCRQVVLATLREHLSFMTSHIISEHPESVVTTATAETQSVPPITIISGAPMKVAA